MDDIRIDVNSFENDVRGYVGRYEVMSMNSRIQGEWMVGSSSCLPTNLNRARLYLECMRRVFEKVDQLCEK